MSDPDDKWAQMEPVMSNIAQLVRGNFDIPYPTTTGDDVIDAFGTGIKMLAETLSETTVSRTHLHNMVNAMRDALFVVDRAGVVLTVNVAMANLLGYSGVDELEGSPAVVVLGDDPRVADDATKNTDQRNGGTRGLFVNTAVAAVLNTPSLTGIELPLRHRDGHLVHTLASGGALVDKRGDVIGVVCVARSQAEWLELHATAARAEHESQRADELQLLNKKLRAAQQDLVKSAKLAALGEVGASVAHELNQPLTALLGPLKAMSDKPEIGAEDRKMLRFMHHQARRMATVVSAMGSLSRPQAVQTTRIPLVNCVDDAVALLRFGLERANITLVTSIADDLPDILGDSGLIEQIIINLLANAKDALCARESPVKGRKIQITARVAPTSSENSGRVELRVSDNGPPIPPEVADHIFEPFFTTKKAGHGTGLGLCISHDAAKDMGGELSLNVGDDGHKEFVLALDAANGGSGLCG